ncbi:MAG: methyltransferase type 11 [Mucilaginibacter sp.]
MDQKIMAMVEIFRTDVNNKRLAAKILKALQSEFPECDFNFDLDDCDRILRVQTSGNVECIKIMQLVKEYAISISRFEE